MPDRWPSSAGYQGHDGTCFGGLRALPDSVSAGKYRRDVACHQRASRILRIKGTVNNRLERWVSCQYGGKHGAPEGGTVLQLGEKLVTIFCDDHIVVLDPVAAVDP